MVKIRLARGGAPKKPFYSIVASNSRSKRDGRFLEKLGTYNPMIEENRVSLDIERAQYWLSVGAQPSERVAKILKQQGIEIA